MGRTETGHAAVPHGLVLYVGGWIFWDATILTQFTVMSLATLDGGGIVVVGPGTTTPLQPLSGLHGDTA